MPRGQRKGVPKCDQHEFYLRPCQENVSHPQQLSLSFCSAHEEKRGKSLGARGGCQQAPIYNTDRSCASPAFILPSDKVFLLFLRTTTDCGGRKCCRSIICVLGLLLKKGQSWYCFSLPRTWLNPDPNTISATSANCTTKTIWKYSLPHPARPQSDPQE